MLKEMRGDRRRRNRVVVVVVVVFGLLQVPLH